eukprot:953716-Prymnesium_polylepis.1
MRVRSPGDASRAVRCREDFATVAQLPCHELGWRRGELPPWLECAAPRARAMQADTAASCCRNPPIRPHGLAPNLSAGAALAAAPRRALFECGAARAHGGGGGSGSRTVEGSSLQRTSCWSSSRA